MKVYRCRECKRKVQIDEYKFAVDCCGVEELVRCIPCKKAEDDLLEREGLGDCKLPFVGFPRL